MAEETQRLAPYAMAARESRGRRYPEGDDPIRTPFQRDRDRIIHSTAFRRLEYKTQVFVNHEGDHYRTRLTHTLEVAQIARTIARYLNLNEDLVEAIALSHDLGHPPFGHAGEEQLADLMQDSGGFNHNRHSLRVVDELERRYPEFPGLNLSWEIREAIAKHYGQLDDPDLAEFEPSLEPLLEAQVVDLSDSLAYDSHDLDDGLRSGVIAERELGVIELWQEAQARVKRRWEGIRGRTLVARTVSQLIAIQVEDLLETTQARLESVRSVDEVRGAGEPLVSFSGSLAPKKAQLQEFLHRGLYRHPRTIMVSEKGKRFIAEIFCEYRREPEQLPVRFQGPISEQGLERTICNYVAGMTDRYGLLVYQRLFVPFADRSVGGGL